MTLKDEGLACEKVTQRLMMGSSSDRNVNPSDEFFRLLVVVRTGQNQRLDTLLYN